MKPVSVAQWSSVPERTPTAALVADVDLVIVRVGDDSHVLYGRCLHRGALLADGEVRGGDLICGVHAWDFRFDTGVSSYNPAERLEHFTSWVEDDRLMVDADEIALWAVDNPQPYDRSAYQGAFQDHHGTPDEPENALIGRLAAEGTDAYGHHGPSAAMGVPRGDLPRWEQIQVLTAQLASVPSQEDTAVDTEVVIGPRAKRPLRLATPLLVSDMSFGALSEEAKVAMAKGADAAGTAICSGEGGALPEEQAANERYMYELATGRFAWSLDRAASASAFHFKLGQGAKTGTGGHLPAAKVTARIAEVREIPAGEAAVSPPAFTDLTTPGDFRSFGDEVREASGGIPIGFKMSAQHIEADIDAALEAGADYIILDGRGGGTGQAPLLFRDNISVPTIPALARARRHLDACGADDVSLIITGGLRTHSDFIKALALGADAIALANSAMQAIGCIAMRACHTNNCPVGIATQKPHLRARLPVDEAAQRLTRFLEASTDLMVVMARALGRTSLGEFRPDDLTSFSREVADLAGIRFGGAGPA